MAGRGGSRNTTAPISELKQARHEALGDESPEVAPREEPGRDVRLGQLAAPIDDVVERRPGVLALDRRLDVSAAPQHLAVHDADHVERLERPPSGPPTATRRFSITQKPEKMRP